jgi:putative membrane protein insertion efficiency factor
VNRLRHGVWVAGAPVRAVLVGLIRGYRATLSGWLGGQCRYYPTCSHYGEEAIRVHGAARGLVLTTWRILRCNPFGEGGTDPVPSPGRYGAVIHRPDSRIPETVR